MSKKKKKKMGRPRLSDTSIEIRCWMREKRSFLRCARRAGFPDLSTYVRHILQKEADR